MDKYIPEDIRLCLEEFYKAFSDKHFDISPMWFSRCVANRIHSEWTKKYPDENHISNPGKGLVDFVNRETHYALERAGYHWNGNCFDDVDGEKYNLFRKLTIAALVKRAVKVLENPKSKKSLMGSLEDEF
jgi:hypothetical protein